MHSSFIELSMVQCMQDRANVKRRNGDHNTTRDEMTMYLTFVNVPSK